MKHITAVNNYGYIFDILLALTYSETSIVPRTLVLDNTSNNLQTSHEIHAKLHCIEQFFLIYIINILNYICAKN